MASLSSAIEAREKGEAPLSIGTSLALESLGGFGEFPNDNPPIVSYNEIWVNLRTLFRNCFNAIERTARDDAQSQDILPALISDMHVLHSTIELKSLNKMSVVFYLCSYRSFEREFPNARWKKLTTNKQITEFQLEEATLKLLLSEANRPADLDIRLYDIRITDRGHRSVMLTHYPSDLLWRDRFEELVLLESHTGKLKKRAEWYTKLTGGKRYDRIPFNRMTLQVFGDGNLLFASMSRKLKEALLELAERYRWTPLTTDDRVRYSLREMYDPRDRTFFMDLLKR